MRIRRLETRLRYLSGSYAFVHLTQQAQWCANGVYGQDVRPCSSLSRAHFSVGIKSSLRLRDSQP